MNVLFLSNNIPITQPLFDWLKDTESDVVMYTAPLKSDMFSSGGALSGIDFVISYGYSHIVSKAVIDLFGERIINLHISFLPWNRGANPNFWSFYENTPKGVTIHQMSEELDKGDIIVQREVRFDTLVETFESSYLKLHRAMFDLFKENWENIKSGEASLTKQECKGSYHSKRETDELLSKHNINWSENISRAMAEIRDSRAEIPSLYKPADFA